MANIKMRDDPATLQELTGLGLMWLTYEEMARYYKVTDRTIYKFFNRCPAAREAFHRGQAMGRLALRRRIMQSNHPAVMIHVARAILGWSHKRQVEVVSRPPVNISDAELAAIISRPSQ
ncbi:hypothetical protein [Methylobacterium sp. WL7]|uniref:hypothetical protein n=1 Tax=Methylobacterium sp. WL7 TaxID=2603900 RepID=UPI0011C7BAB5|nr:hypothetical protein [Methylobacterium sp. WL7]TXN43864.1 hypothetical protein FV233_16805 [Methylobacterium sp. WL7]